MKKILSSIILLTSLVLSSNAYAWEATEITQVANGALAKATKVATEGIKTINEGIKNANDEMNSWLKDQAWFQQGKDMMENLKKLQSLNNELMGLREDMMGMMTGGRDIGALTVNNGSNGAGNIDYRYANQLPQSYLPRISCSGSGTGCVVTGTGYTGKAMSGNSANIRNALRVNDGGVSLTSVDIRQISNEAAEQNAQEIAIIQAMAQEAYMQANNRIAEIEKLEEKIAGVTSSMNSKATYSDGVDGGGAAPAQNNDLKYIADLQAQIQVQNALLINEQNKLAALAILQQSQRDGYEQRKKEIAAHVVNGGSNDSGLVGFVERGLIAAAQTAAYAAVVAAYE